MKRLLSFLVILALLLSFYNGEAAPPDDDKSLLWRISGNGVQKPSYLFGTIHLICPADYLWTDAMKQSLAQCAKVCFELDMDDPSILSAASESFTDTSGKKLRDHFTKAQYARLARFMHDSFSIDLSGFQSMQPIVLQSILLMKTVDCAVPASYEANIMEMAARDKKEIIGLEAVQEQLDALQSLPEDSVITMLMQATDSFAESRAGYAKMIAAYKAQDLPALYKTITESGAIADDAGPLLTDRNKKWIPRITKIVRQQPTFIAVGAGHLPGDAGVIALLRKAGYTVTPVR